MLSVLLLAFLVSVQATPIEIHNHWNGGFEAYITIHADHAVSGWRAHLHFSRAVDSIEIWNAKVVSKLNGGREYIIENQGFDADLTAGQDLKMNFLGHLSGDNPPSGTVTVEGMSGGGSSSGSGSSGSHHTQPPAHTNPPGGGHPITPGQSTSGGSHMKYDYGNALGLSILFFDAQRSGRLPANNPIPWRGDSAVNDHGDGGHDLSGGWYDAGDHVKFNLPMSYSTWVLAWGFIRFQDAYQATGNKQMMCDMIKWPLDYFLKCWVPTENKLYVQVGDGGADHGYWGRPENMHMNRPAYKVDAGHPGSDVAGDTAAAMAAGSIVFKTICGNTAYANQLLTASKSLYAFAKAHQGIYSRSVPQAQAFYGSTGFKDELAVAGAFLYKATNEAQYLNDAKSFHEGGTPWALSWDDTKVAADLLLYEITKDSTYSSDVEAFVRQYMPGGGVQQTPCGLAYRDQWGANRYAVHALYTPAILSQPTQLTITNAVEINRREQGVNTCLGTNCYGSNGFVASCFQTANAAFVAAMAAADGLQPTQFKNFAMSQINYILGDNKQHMSFEIGFGSRYPVHPHHRGSSCRTTTTQCSIGDGGPNPNLLKGALVGGPDGNDNYQDSRSDYVKNEVACDYNAGFQSALAGLKHFALNNQLPSAPAAKC